MASKGSAIARWHFPSHYYKNQCGHIVHHDLSKIRKVNVNVGGDS